MNTEMVPVDILFQKVDEQIELRQKMESIKKGGYAAATTGAPAAK